MKACVDFLLNVKLRLCGSAVGAALVAALPQVFEYGIAEMRSGRLQEPPLQHKAEFPIYVSV